MHGWGVELETTKKQIQLTRKRFDLWYCTDHLAMLPPLSSFRVEPSGQCFIIYILRYTRWKAVLYNFHTQVSSNQSEERTMFITCEKSDTSNQKLKRCVSFVPKFSPFVGVSSLQCPCIFNCFADINFSEKRPRCRASLLGPVQTPNFSWAEPNTLN